MKNTLFFHVAFLGLLYSPQSSAMEESLQHTQAETRLLPFPTDIDKPLENASYYQETEEPFIVCGNIQEKRISVTIYTPKGDKLITYDTTNEPEYKKNINHLIPTTNYPKPVSAICSPDGKLTFFDKNNNELRPGIDHIPANILLSWKTISVYQGYDFSALQIMTIICYKYNTKLIRKILPLKKTTVDKR